MNTDLRTGLAQAVDPGLAAFSLGFSSRSTQDLDDIAIQDEVISPDPLALKSG
jgi:hypothetical protein